MGMQELFPAAFARLNQGLRCGKGQDELPSEGIGPVVKGFQGRRVVFQQCLLELVDEICQEVVYEGMVSACVS